MPTVESNKAAWDGLYDWPNRGDEWSAAWGGPFQQWHGSLLPRIGSFLPAPRILEIACGYGRWTQFLKGLCERMIAVDLSAECIASCKQRFAASSHIDYFENDGRSLHFVQDSSVDFVFSFDSLVHADESVLRAYLGEIARTLHQDGVAFLHHSNLAEYYSMLQRRDSSRVWKTILTAAGMLDTDLHWRDPSVDARRVAAWADESGLSCVSQEIVNWGTKSMLIDCFTVLRRKSQAIPITNQVVRNPKFMEEANALKALAKLYHRSGPPQWEKPGSG